MGEIVHLNLQALLEHDPAGPYLLAGHSFGGAVAFEMARLLQAQGREVRLLLLDSILYLRDSERRQHSTAGYLRGLLAAEGITVPDNDDPRRSDDAHFRGFLKHRTRQHGHARAPLDAEVLENFVRVFEAQLAIYRDYVPSGVFAGPVSVVLAADGAIARMDAAERTQHYCAYCAQTPQSSTVTGNHLSILTQDHAGTLAKSLQASVLAARVEE